MKAKEQELSKAAIDAADNDMRGRQIMEASNEDRMLYSRIFRRGFKAGAEWQKEQMMKGLCFETKVYLESDGCAEDFNESEWLDLENTEITELPVDALGLKAGDKVKVIIVKED